MVYTNRIHKQNHYLAHISINLRGAVCNPFYFQYGVRVVFCIIVALWAIYERYKVVDLRDLLCSLPVPQIDLSSYSLTPTGLGPFTCDSTLEQQFPRGSIGCPLLYAIVLGRQHYGNQYQFVSYRQLIVQSFFDTVP